MHPARFVNLLFFYAGTLYIIQAGVNLAIQLSLESIWMAITGFIFWLFPLERRREPIEEQTPSDTALLFIFSWRCVLESQSSRLD